MSYLSESSDSLVQKASYLRIVARDLAEGIKSGSFRSLYRGQGIEFSGVRDYIRGDDIRSIDWNVTARMGHPYVKVFEEERELQIFLVVDSSFPFLNIKEDVENMGYPHVMFSEFTPNPLYEQVCKGIDLFQITKCDCILAVGYQQQTVCFDYRELFDEMRFCGQDNAPTQRYCQLPISVKA